MGCTRSKLERRSVRHTSSIRLRICPWRLSNWCERALRLIGSSSNRPWLLAALAARELELLFLPVPLPLETTLPWPPWSAICCCCRRIWISEEVRPSEVSGMEVATDIWSRQRHALHSDEVEEAPVSLDAERQDGRKFMMTETSRPRGTSSKVVVRMGARTRGASNES